MWNPNQEKLMWNTLTAQITSDGKYIISQPFEEGQEITITGLLLSLSF